MPLSSLELLRAKARREQAVRGPSRTAQNGNNVRNVPVSPVWDEAEALRYLQRATDHLALCYPDGAWPWAERDRPDLLEDVHAAETAVEDAFRAQGRAAFWRAVDAHEATVRAMFEAYRATLREAFEERAAILEHEAGLPRAEAERRAFALVNAKTTSQEGRGRTQRNADGSQVGGKCA